MFGWPQAHEDDAQRAALVRIGIDAGSVVVGDSAGDSLERQVLGHPLNVAARLQEAAPSASRAPCLRSRTASVSTPITSERTPPAGQRGQQLWIAEPT